MAPGRGKYRSDSDGYGGLVGMVSRERRYGFSKWGVGQLGGSPRVNVKAWTAIVADIESGVSGPWVCPEGDGGTVVVGGLEDAEGKIVEWHLTCQACGAETYVRRGPARRG